MRVVHCKRESYDVYIGRGSKWGNPFVVGKDGTRRDVVRKYETWIASQPQMEQLEELKGMVLGCWCAPRPCHGDVLIKLVQEHTS